MLICFNSLDNSSSLSWEVLKCRAVKHDIDEKLFYSVTFTALLDINESRRSGILVKNSDTLDFALIDINIVS